MHPQRAFEFRFHSEENGVKEGAKTGLLSWDRG